VKLTVVRAIPITLVVAATGFGLSGVPRFTNAQHGLDAVVGEIAWLGFLVAALVTLVAVRRRRAGRGSAPARA
jgi:hypothetical protein